MTALLVWTFWTEDIATYAFIYFCITHVRVVPFDVHARQFVQFAAWECLHFLFTLSALLTLDSLMHSFFFRPSVWAVFRIVLCSLDMIILVTPIWKTFVCTLAHTQEHTLVWVETWRRKMHKVFTCTHTIMQTHVYYACTHGEIIILQINWLGFKVEWLLKMKAGLLLHCLHSSPRFR